MTTEDAIWIARDGQRHGPYPEADIRQWLKDGQIFPTTLGWREGMPEWLPLSALLDGVQAAPPQPTFTAQPEDALDDARASLPTPPSLHWLIVFVLSIVTGGIFAWIWVFVQANWVKKIDPKSIALPLAIVALVIGIGGVFAFRFIAGIGQEFTGMIINLAASLISLCAYFSMKASITADMQRRGITMAIGGLTLFFFQTIYMQGQMTWLARWKQTGQTEPAPPKAVFWWLSLAGLTVFFLGITWFILGFGSTRWV